jgi:tetratricopeptide (TPR) repeat protein
VAELEPEPSPLQKLEETVAEQEEEPSKEEFPFEAEATGEISLEIDESDIDGAEWMKELGAPGGSTGGDVSFELSEEPDSELFSDESGVGLETPSSDVAVQPEGEIAAFEPAPSAERPEEAAPAPKKRKKYDLEGQFSEFKKGLDQQLEEGDTETHYNLGIAYKEMGLLDDAVSEFRIAAMDPKRRTDCLTLQGICNRDKGDFASAEAILTMALADGGLSSEEILNLNYEIASLCEAMGRNDDALSYYRKAKALNPGFRDVANRIASLQGGEERDDAEFLELEDEEAEH